MSDFLYKLAHAPAMYLFITAGLTAVAFYFGFSGLRRTRHIEDVPTARVRSAPQGYVELIGKARMLDGEPIIAPLSKTACCWYSYRIQKYNGKNWSTVETGTSDAIFALHDATGICVIDPEGAEVSTNHKRSWFDNGSGWEPPGVHMRTVALGAMPDLLANWSGRIFESIGVDSGDYRYTEALIMHDDPLYVIGQFRTLSPADQVASLSQLTAEVLREWKQRPDTLRERFDTNRDGLIDAEEWERARRLAEKQASAELAEHLLGESTHTLGKPADGRYFLLSNMEEFDLLSRYRWRMRLGFFGFALFGGSFILMLSTRV
ncbi:GIDE domain-containing protein [Thiosocius teredinicola]|uniref:GIDE domain-containing protein n=1 Tax=Thiosocius teredinicola TaxID=1973002 RepID=UPI000990AB1F